MAQTKGRRIGQRYGAFLLNDGSDFGPFIRHLKQRHADSTVLDEVVLGIKDVKEDPLLLGRVLTEEEM